ncbi:MAG TPA: TraR/DksA family transcriptional regulator [Anaeromyxobacteraceae bacterium]|nr:TraR/DksA family transcriptional regulator [Anaeromyxobacteraceae bacterium]
MAESLTAEQLASLRAQLEQERRRLVGVLYAAHPAPTAAAEGPTDLEEEAQRVTEQAHVLGVAERERALLVEVDRALAKFDAGTYGISEKTGDPIPFERLAVMPWARQGVDE